MAEPVNDMKPRRRAGRPKGSKNKKTLAVAPVVVKSQEQHKVPLIVPLLPTYWRAKKMSWHLKNLERHLLADPLFITPKEYFALLKDLDAVYKELESEGLGTNDLRKEARKRVQSERLAKDGKRGAAPDLGSSRSAGVDNGVPAPNPFGG